MNPQDSQIHFCAVVVSLMPGSLPQMDVDRPGPGEELKTSGPAAVEPSIDGEEIVDSGWFAPAGALEAYGRGELELVFPTIKHLEQLALFASADEVLEYAHGREVRPVEPKVVMSGETARVVLPGEPGYND